MVFFGGVPMNNVILSIKSSVGLFPLRNDSWNPFLLGWSNFEGELFNLF